MPGRDEDVPAVWQALGLPGCVDVHTHFMPRRVLEKVWAYFDGAERRSGRAWPILYRRSEEARIAHLRSLGARAFTSLLYPHKRDMARWLNAWAADFAARTPDCLHSATFYPENGAGAYVAEALRGGARVFKAHVQVGAYDPRDPLLDEVWGTLAESGTPVVVHCGSGPTPGEFTGPAVFAEVLARHPRLVAVVAHMGAPEYDAFADLASRYERVHLDTTMAFTDFMEDVMPSSPALRARLADLGDRVLFGSDFPNIPYAYAHQVEALVRLDLGDDWLRRVCHDNAVRLFGLDGAVEGARGARDARMSASVRFPSTEAGDDPE
ncbi:MAG: amidohydrolase family protein [Actinomycetes bacterium]